MPFDLASVIAERGSDAAALHDDHINPKWRRALRLIGFDRTFVRAEGSSLWDTSGNRYLDMIGGYAVCNVGRNHPTVKRALSDFLASNAPSMVQFETPLLAGVLARELKARVGRDLDRVFFTNSGAEGIEAAIKFSRCATGRGTMLYETGAFHGLTTGALAMNGCESFREGFGPFPTDFRAVQFNDLASLEKELSRGDVAAFVVEPIQGKGVRIHSEGFLAQASQLCHQHGALFVVDEIQTGVGRTGSFLAIDQEGSVDADMVVMSKALSGGYVPVGAVLLRTALWERVFSRLDRSIVHSSTFHMGGLAMVAGLAVLSVYDDERLGEIACERGSQLKRGLETMRSRFEFIGEIRQRGLMVGIEFRMPQNLALGLAWRAVHALDENLFTQAVTIPLMEDHHILSQVAGHGLPVLKLTPPLNISAVDIDGFLRAFETTMVGLHRFPGPTWDVLRRIASNALLGAQPTELCSETRAEADGVAIRGHSVPRDAI